jgi:hypothetical protein
VIIVWPFYVGQSTLWRKEKLDGRIKSKLNMASKGFHHRHMIKLDGQYCEVYQEKRQGISLLLQDGTWWPKQYVYQVQYQMVFTLTFYEDYWLVQRNYLWDFKLSFDKGHVVIYITLDLQMEVCKRKNIWYQSKDKQIEWHLKWVYL